MGYTYAIAAASGIAEIVAPATAALVPVLEEAITNGGSAACAFATTAKARRDVALVKAENFIMIRRYVSV